MLQQEVVGYNEETPVDFDALSCATSVTSLESTYFDIDSKEEDFVVPRVLICYGSETGTAEAAAGRVGRALRLCKPTICCLNDVAGLDIIKTQAISHMLVLCSTFGAGSAPSNASLFMETDIPSKQLADTKVAVLALGSSMYPDFCKAGTTVDQLLKAAGAVELSPLTKADEAVDSRATIAQWIQLAKNLIMPPALENQIEMSLGATEPVEYKIKWDNEKPQPTKPLVTRLELLDEEKYSMCRINEELIDSNDPTRSTRRIAFDMPPDQTYETGDHLQVQPLNSLDMVMRFAMCFEDELMNDAIACGRPSEGADKLVHYQLQQMFTVECHDNGQVYPAQTCFSTPNTLQQVLQANVNL